MFKQQQSQVGASSPALDSTALWKFETLDPQWGGDDLKSGVGYRMKNVATGLYLEEVQVKFASVQWVPIIVLQVASELGLAMTPEYLNTTTGWVLKPFQGARDQHGQIFAGSLVQFVNW